MTTESEEQNIVIIQCDSGHLHSDLIACARYRVYDLMARGDQEQITHVLFIINLPRQLSCPLVGFQGDPWISYHIDDLIPTEADNAIELSQVLGDIVISNLFMGKAPFHEHVADNSVEGMVVDIAAMEQDSNDGKIVASDVKLEDVEMTEEHFEDVEGEELMNKEDTLVSPKLNISPSYKPFYRNLCKCIQPAASKLKDITMKRSTERVNILVDLIPKNIEQVGGKFIFLYGKQLFYVSK